MATNWTPESINATVTLPPSFFLASFQSLDALLEFRRNWQSGGGTRASNRYIAIVAKMDERVGEFWG
jgi:hypothetical protein